EKGLRGHSFAPKLRLSFLLQQTSLPTHWPSSPVRFFGSSAAWSSFPKQPPWALLHGAGPSCYRESRGRPAPPAAETLLHVCNFSQNSKRRQLNDDSPGCSAKK